MKTKQMLRAIAGMACGLTTAQADSTITTGSQHGYGANVGWNDWKWDTGAPEGVTVGTYVVEGKVYAANVGWIDLGDGAPDDGIHYSLTNGDWGVNHDGAGGLLGHAYGANIGWITFNQTWSDPPRIDLVTGAMSGHAYAANVGWIRLDGIETTIVCSPDSDSDGIEDAWEYEQLAAAGQPADLSLLGAGDADSDGSDDVDEFEADTAPFDASDRFRLQIVNVDATTGDVDLSWTSSPRRIYDADHDATLSGSWTNFASDILGGTHTHATGTLPGRLFYRVEASIPLKP